MTTTYAVNAFGACISANSQGTSTTDGGSSAGGTDVCQSVNGTTTATDPVITELKIAINILSFAIGVASVIIIILSALRMVLNGSDPQALSRSRSGIIYAIAGITITVISQAIVLFVLDRIT